MFKKKKKKFAYIPLGGSPKCSFVSQLLYENAKKSIIQIRCNESNCICLNCIILAMTLNTCLCVCLQHLSTFIMDKTESITTVDDAIKKLKLLDSKDKIWTQEMLLQVTDKSIKLLDCETKVSVSFPCVVTRVEISTIT